MLDLEKREPSQQKLAEDAMNNSKILTELLEGLLSKKCAVRYKNFKAVYLISEDHPEVLYPKWDFFQDLLISENNTFVFYAIHILANLVKVDEAHKFDAIFQFFYDIVKGDALVPACHVAYVSHKIAKSRPELADQITEKLLNLKKATYKHKELVQANALHSFSKYFDQISDKDIIVRFARDLQNSASGQVKKEAALFLKKQLP